MGIFTAPPPDFGEQKRKQSKKKQNLPPPDEEMEEEMEFSPHISLNRQENIFDANAINRQAGINGTPSVFNQKAIFHSK